MPGRRPAWALTVEGDALLAKLTRQPQAGATLAALDDPFACAITGSPARIRATATTLATRASGAAANVTGAFRASYCSEAAATSALAGFVLQTDAEGQWLAQTASEARSAAGDCSRQLRATFVPLATTQVTLQAAATAASTDIGAPWGNWTSNNWTGTDAALLGLCAPVVASALSSFNVSAPLASVQASLEENAKTRMWQILGPIGGTLGLVLLGAVGTCLRRRQVAGKAAKDAAGKGGADADADYVPMLPR